jgi:RNA polymerase sigma-70 factor (ECF subfamily)
MLLTITGLYDFSCMRYLSLSNCNKAGLMGTEPDHQNTQTPGIDAEQIAMLREEMVRFATLQLRDATQAEDAVHDAINAALSPGKYTGSGSLKSWVYAILRNKIIDVIRERSRHPTESYIEDECNCDDQFDEKDHWKRTQTPSNWGQPDALLANEQFWIIFNVCLNRLPENTARVFMMREHLGLELTEICTELDITDKNAWVIMHRARMQLRQCLEINFITGAHL